MKKQMFINKSGIREGKCVAGIKKPKKPKSPKKVKLPKEAIRHLSDRDARKIAKRVSKQDKKRKKAQNRQTNLALGITAVCVCVVSSVLDVIAARKNNKKM